MGGSLLIAVGITAVAWAQPTPGPECPDRNARLDLADALQAAVVEADLSGAATQLEALEAALGCGWIAEAEVLGRMWLAEGALLSLQGDPDGAEDAWRAAARISPGLWVEDFGGILRTEYESAIDLPQRRSSIQVDPPLFEFIGAVDGRVVDFPYDVQAGLHLVQVGPAVDEITFARILLVFPDIPSVVVTGVQEMPLAMADPVQEPPEPPPEVEAGPPEVRLALHAAVGGAVAFGTAFDTDPATGDPEPGVQLTLPVESGLVVRPTPGSWIRLSAAAAPLVGGRFVYDDAFGIARSPASVGGHLAGGFTADQGDMGLLLGYHWPGRWQVRGLVAGQRDWKLPVGLEGRIGLSMAPGRSPAPSLELLFTLRPRMVRSGLAPHS